MHLLKSAAICAINIVTKNDSPWAIHKVASIIGAYAAYAQPEKTNASPDKIKHFHEVVQHGCKAVAESQTGLRAKFFVEMFHYLPQEASKYFPKLKHPDNVAVALYEFADGKDDELMLKRTFEGLLAIQSWESYNEIIYLLGHRDEYVEILIDKIKENKIYDKARLLFVCFNKNDNPYIQKKIFETLCELSKSDDIDLAEEAQDFAVDLFYECDDDWQYFNIANLTPVLEDVSKKNPVPSSLMPLFAKVTDPQNGLEDFVKVRMLRKSLVASGRSDTTIDLMAAFERIDRDNGNKGYPTPLLAFYKMLNGVAKMQQDVCHAHMKAFDLGGQ